MFRFEYPDHLYALLALPALILAVWVGWYLRSRSIRRLGNPAMLRRMMPGYSEPLIWLKTSLLLVAFALLVVGWANPQWGSKKEKAKRKGVDVFIALDISQSMLAEDIAPSRLERAKRFAQNLITAMNGNRVGLLFFAGNAYLQMPLTTDYAAAELFLRSANTDLAATQGTAIGEAVDLAMRSFEANDKFHRALVLISDGENHDDEAIEKVTEASEKGLLIFTAGIGTVEGGLIPVNVGGRQDYKRDDSGNPVRSRLDEKLLQNLSEKANGAYFNIGIDGEEIVLEELRSKVEKMEKREFEQRSFTEFESYFQYFLGAALCLLLLEFFSERRKQSAHNA